MDLSLNHYIAALKIKPKAVPERDSFGFYKKDGDNGTSLPGTVVTEYLVTPRTLCRFRDYCYCFIKYGQLPFVLVCARLAAYSPYENLFLDPPTGCIPFSVWYYSLFLQTM
jgi:hypothetical protein